MGAAAIRSLPGRLCALLFSLGLVLQGCAGGPGNAGNPVTGGARVQSQGLADAPPVRPASVVYVQDFAIEVEKDAGTAWARPRLLPGITGQDPARKAGEIVQTMSRSLVADLRASGVPALHLLPGQPLPAEGWLVRGAFTEMDSGNRVRSAVIGFGAGSASMEVQLTVSDLAAPPAESVFLVMGTVTDPGRLPGGAVTRNPYAVAAKFALSKDADKKDVSRTAASIAKALSEVQAQIRSGTLQRPLLP